MARIGGLFLLIAISGFLADGVWASPEQYPEFAAHGASQEIKPQFIHVAELVDAIVQRKPVVIVDVRAPDEYDQQHIKGAASLPLRDLGYNLDLIPKDKLVVFY